MKTYSLGIILALILLALFTTIAYLMGLKDGMRGLEAIEAQNENVMLELTHDRDVQLEMHNAPCEQRIQDMCVNQGKGLIIPLCGGNITMPQPLLHLGNIGVGGERIGDGRLE
jgi:hypothetical protein